MQSDPITKNIVQDKCNICDVTKAWAFVSKRGQIIYLFCSGHNFIWKLHDTWADKLNMNVPFWSEGTSTSYLHQLSPEHKPTISHMWMTHETLIFSLCSLMGDIWVLAWMSWCHKAASSFWRVFAIFMFLKSSLPVPLVPLSLPSTRPYWTASSLDSNQRSVSMNTDSLLRDPETTYLFYVCFYPLQRENKAQMLKGRLCSHPHPVKTGLGTSWVPRYSGTRMINKLFRYCMLILN